MTYFGIAGMIAFTIAMVLYAIFARRKSERDYECMMESNRKHAEWMVNSGRDWERYEQIKRDADTRQSWILC